MPTDQLTLEKIFKLPRTNYLLNTNIMKIYNDSPPSSTIVFRKQLKKLFLFKRKLKV